MKPDSDHFEVPFDARAGTIGANVYVDEDIYRRELDQIFSRCWLFLGHESQLGEKPGSFFSSYMAEDPIIVVRQKDGSIKALLNQCRHRGMRVCRSDDGIQKNFMCAYHGWTYATDGSLINVPGETGAYRKELNKEEWGLREVTRITNYRGFLFGTWDIEAPEFADYMGDFRWYFDELADHTPAGTEVIGGIHRWVIPANWKLPAEQFASDMYHASVSHASAMSVLVPKDGSFDASTLPTPTQGRQFASRSGHGIGFYTTGDPTTSLVVGSEASEWAESNPITVEHLGDPRGNQMRVGHATLFPNFSYLSGIRTIRVWHPRGPGEIEVWSWALVDKDQPEEVREAFRRGVSRSFSPAGLFEQDDGENWTEIQRMLKGHIARGSTFNMQMGLGHESRNDPDFPGTTNRVYSETAARFFYQRWADLLAGKTWQELEREALEKDSLLDAREAQ